MAGVAATADVAPIPAQTGVDATGSAGTTDEIDSLDVLSLDTSVSGRVSLQVTVPEDRADQLTADSVEVRLDDEIVDGVTVRPVQIDSLHAILVLDVSQSMAGEPIEAAKDSAVAFIDALPPQAEVTIIGFGSTARVEADATPDHADAIATVQSLELRGETALYDAVKLGLDSTASASRTAMVLLSDGGDTASSVSEAAVIDQLATGSTDLYAIALTSEESDGSALRALTDAADGRLQETGDLAGLQAIYQELAGDLAEVYEIGFPVSSGGRHRLEVAAPGTEGDLVWERAVNLAGPRASTEVVIEQPAPEVVVAPPPSPWANPNLLWAGVVLVGLSVVALVAGVVLRPAGDRKRRRPALGAGAGTQVQTLKEIRRDASSVVEVVVNRSVRDRIAGAADRAGLKWRAGEVLMASFAMSVVMAVVVATTVTPLAAPLGFVVGLFLPKFYLGFRFKQRSKKFANQLPDILAALANVMRAGYSLNRAVDAVAREAEEPARGEFMRALVESRIGGDFVASLRAMSDRTGSVDLKWTADAVEINTTVGGDLTEVLDSVAETIRGRIRLKAQVDALTAEGRVSALILFILPPAITTFIVLVNPQYFSGIWDGYTAYIMIGGVILMMGIGGLWLKKMINAV